MPTIRIRAEYDPEAQVWVAQSDDIALVTEADTVDALREKLPAMIRDLLETIEPDTVFELIARSEETLAIRAA